MRTTDPIHRNARGSAADRRARRRWLLVEFGDGATAPCWRRSSPNCLGVVDELTLTVDRVVMGRDGGRYTRDNVVPSCASCNYSHGARSRFDR